MYKVALSFAVKTQGRISLLELSVAMNGTEALPGFVPPHMFRDNNAVRLQLGRVAECTQRPLILIFRIVRRIQEHKIHRGRQSTHSSRSIFLHNLESTCDL